VRAEGPAKRLYELQRVLEAEKADLLAEGVTISLKNPRLIQVLFLCESSKTLTAVENFGFEVQTLETPETWDEFNQAIDEDLPAEIQDEETEP
jgi:hypothetical protein